MKKVLVLLLTLVIVVGCLAAFTACGSKTTAVDDGAGVTIATKVNTDADYSYLGDLTGKTLKVGVILVGDETEGYTKAHMDGITEAIANIQAKTGSVEVLYKKKVGETSACSTAAEELISSGCTLIISNSYGHQDFMASVAKLHSDITFIAMTGDYASISGLSNLKNAFTDIYEARYVSGVIAGMKLKQLVDDNKLSTSNYNGENIKIGYVGAYNYAEVVSGYTAFYLGIKSVVSNVTMDVQYTKSWFDYDKEYETAKSLIADGCVIIGQHADSVGAPTACEEAYMGGTRVYSVGYNVNMLTAAPHAALTSATNNWAVYYTYAFNQAINGEAIATDSADGYSKGAVGITDINGKVFTSDPSATIKTIVDGIVAETLKVFDVSKFTVNKTATTAAYQSLPTYDDNGNITAISLDLSYFDYSKNPPEKVYTAEAQEALKTAVEIKYFSESTIRSAPYFGLRIDGITELTREAQ